MGREYLIRYGRMHLVGRFRADDEGTAHGRGGLVVVESPRGVELGEVLAPVGEGNAGSAIGRLLRSATGEDRALAGSAEGLRGPRLDACDRVFGDGVWPLTLIDVEPLPLAGQRRTVLYYLGPHHLDAVGLRQMLLESHGIDAVFQPVGRDEPAAAVVESGGCGSGGCGSGGCGDSGGGCGTGDHGCSSCGVKELVRRGARARAGAKAT